MGGISFHDAVRVPVALCILMLTIAVITSHSAGVDGRGLLWAYTSVGTLVTLTAMLVWVFGEVAKLGRKRAENPLAIVWSRLPGRLPMLVLPCLVFPLFLAGFTTAKTSIHFLVGFRWDRFWADADLLLLRVDPWIVSHRIVGSFATEWWAWGYTFLWGAVIAFTKSFVAIYAERRFVATFYTAMLTTWVIGGWLLAYCLSAAGPVFAHIYDPELAPRFAPLRASLEVLLESDNAVRLTQAYLGAHVGDLVAARGGGISAMPSMHVSACTILIIAARGTRWLVPAILFWLLIAWGSVHFGYHYAIDSLVAVMVAYPCWRAADRFYRLPAARKWHASRISAA